MVTGFSCARSVKKCKSIRQKVKKYFAVIRRELKCLYMQGWLILHPIKVIHLTQRSPPGDVAAK